MILFIIIICALALILGVGFAVWIYEGIQSISVGDFRNGFIILTPAAVIVSIILFFVYKSNGNSWDFEMILFFLLMGLMLITLLLHGGISLISKKETIPVIIGTLLLLSAATLFILVYVPIIKEIYEALKLLGGIIIILFVVANIIIIL